MDPDIRVTETAAQKAKELLAGSKTPEDALRLRVVNGGCSGMRYELVFDGGGGENDRESEQFGLRVVIDTESLQYVEGTTVDYSDDLNDAGFKIQNPLADETCGCGDSFGML